MCEYTAKTVELFSITAKPEVWSPSRQIVANVFKAFPTAAFSHEQVYLIGRAIGALKDCPENQEYIEDALKFFVRRKVLRSRMGNNKLRLWEVNY
jgi:hypothetical protein